MRALFLCLALLPLPALAQPVDTPRCRADLPRAHQMISAVAARDRQGPIADNARLCAVLRQNSADMRGAAEIMNRCLTGHARGENVGQLMASVGDVNAVIARRCR